MKTSTPSKKEIRIKVGSKLYSLLSQNASSFGVKPNDYIVHLILDDIKVNQSSQIPYLDNQSEGIVEEGYQEINQHKKKTKLKSFSAEEIARKIA